MCVQYYKGLGTSTAKEAKDYFMEIDTHRINFQWTASLLTYPHPPTHPPYPISIPTRQDTRLAPLTTRGAPINITQQPPRHMPVQPLPRHACVCVLCAQGDEDGDLIDMAFAKKRVEDRKDWLRGFTKGTHVDYKARGLACLPVPA
jgi:hypothetical protein